MSKLENANVIFYLTKTYIPGGPCIIVNSFVIAERNASYCDSSSRKSSFDGHCSSVSTFTVNNFASRSFSDKPLGILKTISSDKYDGVKIFLLATTM